jgi:hypothetical protein
VQMRWPTGGVAEAGAEPKKPIWDLAPGSATLAGILHGVRLW